MKILVSRVALAVSALALSLHFSFGCRSNPAEPSGTTPTSTTGVYIVNEGNFQRGNSTLTVYLPDSNKAYQDVFALANGRNLGDTGNDIVLYGGKAYIVVSGSQRIEVISLETNKSFGTITFPGKRNPYRLVILNDAKAFVTNLSDSSITEFNPSTLQIVTDRIKVGTYPMGILGANGKVYVCNSGFGYDSTVTVLNATTGGLIKTIVIGDSPSEIGVGPNNEVIVKCDGRSDYVKPANDTPGSISKINADNDVVFSKVTLPLATYGHPGRMTISSKGVGYFQAKTGVIKFSYTGSIISVGGTPFSTITAYGLAYDDVTDRLYVTDAKDYAQPGDVYILDTNGASIRQFLGGVIPGAIAFKH
ncbi:MAG: YncE family protein [Ignavibacteriales bacterium]|nr:YncE family protein [Ignavibacteriales bacterium]